MKYIILILSLALSACALHQEPLPQEPPVTLQVSEPFIRDDKLGVNVIIIPKTELEPKQLLVTLKETKNAELLSEQTKQISDLTAIEALAAREPLKLFFELKSPESDQFQVTCKWDLMQEAVALPVATPAHTPEPTPAPVSIPTVTPASRVVTEVKKSHDIQILTISKNEDCKSGVCAKRTIVTARITNNTDQPLTNIILAFGLFWTDGVTPLELPTQNAPRLEQEEQIDLKQLTIQPNRSKVVRFNLNFDIPEVELGKIVPNVRFL